MDNKALKKTNPIHRKNIVIGYGNMGKLIAHCIQDSQLGTLFVCDPHMADPLQKGATANKKPQIQDITFIRDRSEIATKVPPLTGEDTVFFCVKTRDFHRACDDWHPLFEALEGTDTPLIISILPGLTIRRIRTVLGEEFSVLRAMPNLGVQCQAAATVLCSSPNAEAHHKQRAQDLFDRLGKSWFLEENLMDAATGLSGSGPALVFLFMESMIQAGIYLGLPQPIAQALATQTVLGSALVAQDSSLPVSALKDLVSTPGGTTVSGLFAAENKGLRAAVMQSVIHAAVKSKRLSKKKYE